MSFRPLTAAVGTYLANQYFPGEIKTEYYGYDNVQTDDPTAAKTVYKVLKSYPITGVYENNSDTYFVVHFLSMLALAECASDETIKAMAQTALHNSIFTFAPVWLNGHISVAQQRCYSPYTSENDGGMTNTLLWYYFGGRKEYPSFDKLDYAEAIGMGFVLWSDFIPHWISVAMANDRSEVYNHVETHTYYKDRSNWDLTFLTFMKTYMHQDYAVFSEVDIHTKMVYYVKYLRGTGRILWGVDWTTEDPNEKSNFSIHNFVRDLSYTTHVQSGATVYSQVLQNDGTVIGVFDLPEEYDSRYPDYVYNRYITINMPNNYKAIIDDSATKGEMYLHYGNLLIGFKLSIPFNYQGEEQTHTSDITKAYFVCEVMDVDDVEGDTIEEQLEYFQSLLLGRFRKITYDYSDRTKISYTSVDNVFMELQAANDGYLPYGKIGDEVQNYYVDSWASQSNPWIEAAYGDKVITYTYKDKSVTFDFEKNIVFEWEIG